MHVREEKVVKGEEKLVKNIHYDQNLIIEDNLYIYGYLFNKLTV